MKHLLFSTILMVLAVNICAQQKQTEDFGLPILHVIKEITLAPSYSCRSSEDFQKGYSETALFVSDYSKKVNSPDLLFNGACNSDDSFQASTAGNDISLIADLGENVSFESLSAHKTLNLRNIGADDEYSKFSSKIKVQNNHTHAILLNKGDLRGLIVFSVTDYEKNKKVTLKYAVKMYEIFPKNVKANGFNWEKGNAEK